MLESLSISVVVSTGVRFAVAHENSEQQRTIRQLAVA